MQQENLLKLNQAKDYLAKHRIKEIYSRLINELTQHRPNNPYDYMVNRLKDMKVNGIDHPIQERPRITAIITNASDDFEVVQALKHLAVDMNMKFINAKQFRFDPKEIKTEIDEYVETTSYKDFLVYNYPRNIKEVVTFEKDFTEFDNCLFFNSTENNNMDIDIVKQYFESIDKLTLINVDKEEVLYQKVISYFK
ncbi:hypothetical protein ABK040_015315 [Willaertia magna]